MADISFDASSNSGYQASSSSYSWSHTNNGNYLSVDVSRLSVPGTTVTGITYNGVSLTNIGTQASGTDAGNVSMWGLVAPATGTHTIAVTLSGVAISVGNAVSYSGVHQTSPTGGFNGATSVNVGAADAKVFITSVSGNCWIHDAVATTDTSVTAEDGGFGINSRNNVSGAGGSGANADTGPVPIGAIETLYTDIGATQTWVIAGYVMRPVDTSSFFMFFN